MRLFVAIPLPEALKAKLEQLQEPIDGFRWLVASQMHLTLRFIGEADKDEVRLIKQELQKIQHPAFNLKCEGLGFFPNRINPRILWIGIEPNKSLMELQAGIEEICRQIGRKPDKRKFKPHITLGRNNHATPAQLQAYIREKNLPHFETFRVGQFNLYKSTLSESGSVYKVVKHYPLKNPG